MKNAFANLRARGENATYIRRARARIFENHGGNYENVHKRDGVKPSAHVAKARVSPVAERPGIYLACIHMQIPIDMTTFTYCIFALGHILARQFPIVGFRPPVRLIDIIGRAADTRLHFYLHTFANQFERPHTPPRSPSFRCGCVHPSRPVPTFRIFPPATPATTIGQRFSFRRIGPFARLYRVCHISACIREERA